MKPAVLNQKHTHTTFVSLNSYACAACWKCIEICPNDVIDKSFLFITDTLIHQQVLMYDTTKCTGCKLCVESCPFDAISFYKQ